MNLAMSVHKLQTYTSCMPQKDETKKLKRLKRKKKGREVKLKRKKAEKRWPGMKLMEINVALINWINLCQKWAASVRELVAMERQRSN